MIRIAIVVPEETRKEKSEWAETEPYVGRAGASLRE